jgi:hypothetical protein
MIAGVANCGAASDEEWSLSGREAIAEEMCSIVLTVVSSRGECAEGGETVGEYASEELGDGGCSCARAANRSLSSRPSAARAISMLLSSLSGSSSSSADGGGGVCGFGDDESLRVASRSNSSNSSSSSLMTPLSADSSPCRRGDRGGDLMDRGEWMVIIGPNGVSGVSGRVLDASASVGVALTVIRMSWRNVHESLKRQRP